MIEDNEITYCILGLYSCNIYFNQIDTKINVIINFNFVLQK